MPDEDRSQARAAYAPGIRSIGRGIAGKRRTSDGFENCWDPSGGPDGQGGAHSGQPLRRPFDDAGGNSEVVSESGGIRQGMAKSGNYEF